MPSPAPTTTVETTAANADTTPASLENQPTPGSKTAPVVKTADAMASRRARARR